MKIASFNVNSVRAHFNNVYNWVQLEKPDVILFQELKCETDKFPFMDFEMLGYNCEVMGQKSWNGVAILSKFKIEECIKGIPDFNDSNSRYIEVWTGGVRIINIYFPNGNPLGSEKFTYKLNFMEALKKHLETLKKYDEPVIIGGDFNVIPYDTDVHNTKGFINDAVMQPEVRKAFFEYEDLGFKSVKTMLYPEKQMFSYWDYRHQAKQKNMGILLDFFLLNDKAQKMVKDFWIDEAPRDAEKSSDHTPILITFY